MPIQLMHKDKADSVKAVSVRGVHLSPMSVGVAECVVSRELPDFILEPVDNFTPGCSQRVPSINLGNRINSV